MRKGKQIGKKLWNLWKIQEIDQKNVKKITPKYPAPLMEGHLGDFLIDPSGGGEGDKNQQTL